MANSSTELSKEKIKEYINRIMKSRIRLLSDYGFYGLVLSHLTLSLDPSLDTAATDGERIYFSPKFLDELKDSELDFIIMHELLHVVLKHVERTDLRDNYIFNIACDIVVNSNILYSSNMNESSITINKYGVSMHLTPNGDEGYLHTAEEVYEMLLKDIKKNGCKGGKTVYTYDPLNADSFEDEKNNNADSKNKSKNTKKGAPGMPDYENGINDDHSKWGNVKIDSDELDRIIEDAYNESKNSTSGNAPFGAERLIKNKYLTKTNWREILREFLVTDERDYSFNPPDRRYSSEDFFLPDFNPIDDGKIENILFFIDTSGSISKKDLEEAYNEIRTAIDAFNSKLSGELGFFDAKIYKPVPFKDINSLDEIKPKGGGGTDFSIVFKYVSLNYPINSLKCLIILTDGECTFPNPKILNDLPLIWLINNNKVTPPYGKVVRMHQ